MAQTQLLPLSSLPKVNPSPVQKAEQNFLHFVILHMNNRTRQRINLHYKSMLVAFTRSLLCQQMETSIISSFRTSGWVDCYMQRQDHTRRTCSCHAALVSKTAFDLKRFPTFLQSSIKSFLKKHQSDWREFSSTKGIPMRWAFPSMNNLRVHNDN